MASLSAIAAGHVASEGGTMMETGERYLAAHESSLKNPNIASNGAAR
jgi:hypothetical protein